MGDTVIDVPLPADVPPQLTVYHCQLVAPFNEPDVMLMVVLLPEQIVVAVALNTGTEGNAHNDIYHKSLKAGFPPNSHKPPFKSVMAVDVHLAPGLLAGAATP